MKKLILFIFIILLFQVMETNSFDINAFTCSVKTSCNAYEQESTIFYMYNNVDTHVSTTNTNWPYKLCCTKLINSCGGLNTELFKLYLSQDGHVSTLNPNWDKLCLSVYGAQVSQGSIACDLKSSCANNEQCIVTLSSPDDAHVSACKDANNNDIGYSNKLCCGATVCPAWFKWDPGVNQGKGGCIADFAACYVGDSTKLVSDEGVCKDKWRAPIKQSDPYWGDAVDANAQDCFDSSSGANARACCPLTTYKDKDYGKYQDVIVKKFTI